MEQTKQVSLPGKWRLEEVRGPRLFWKHAASEGRGQTGLPLSAEAPHTRGGLSVTGLLPVASAFSGWLTHPQTQPLPLGVGLLQPSHSSS